MPGETANKIEKMEKRYHRIEKEALRKIFFETWRSKKNNNTSLNRIKHNFERYLAVHRIHPQLTDVVIYEPFLSEINILKIINHMEFRNTYVPKVRGSGLLFKSLIPNKFIPNHRANLIIVPALFVQKDGYRLGRGRGYYDRLLRFFPFKKKIFLGYDWQVRNQVPIEQHDQRVSAIITDLRFINCYQS